jgi:tripartite-type tricarboxylate transporter receptor subunit TctC
MQRWRPLVAAVVAMSCAIAADVASAQSDFPNRPVRIVVPFAAGGPTDVVMRALADGLAARWGQTVIVENKPGAGTVVGNNFVAKSVPDGYTLLSVISAFVTSAAARVTLPYDPIDDFVGVSMTTISRWALVAYPKFPASNVAELVAQAKSGATLIDYAAPGIGGLGHMAGELLQRAAGIKMQFIPYGGSAVAWNDVMAGRVPVMFDVWHSVRPHVESGSLKLIGAAGATRLAEYPAVPSIAEAYPGFDVSGFQGIIAPRKVPPALLAKISADVQAVVRSREFGEKMKSIGGEAAASTPEELSAHIAREIAKWKEVAKAANIRIE